MPTFLNSVILVVVSALTVFATRALPFLIFKNNTNVPSIVVYLGKVLPGAVIAVLVVYCLKDVAFANFAFLPELISIACVVALHLYKRNNLLSIGGGTIIYMILVQVVFK